jgi:high-affinity nickel-transport protein
MSLLDTIDGSFMNFAYQWAFSKPVRKVYYNLTITGLSVAVAWIIGTVELLGLIADKAHLKGAFWRWIGGLDLNALGYFIVALFFGTWVIAMGVWKYAGIENRWTTSLAADGGERAETLQPTALPAPGSATSVRRSGGEAARPCPVTSRRDRTLEPTGREVP